jgi:hypothetical protein
MCLHEPVSFRELVTSRVKQMTFGKIYLSLSAPTAFVTAARRPLTMAPLAHGGELLSREAPVLNMTSVEKCCHKKSLGKNMYFS